MNILEPALGAVLVVAGVDQTAAALRRSLPGVASPPLYVAAAAVMILDHRQWRRTLASAGLALCISTALDVAFDVQTNLRTKVVRGLKGIA